MQIARHSTRARQTECTHTCKKVDVAIRGDTSKLRPPKHIAAAEDSANGMAMPNSNGEISLNFAQGQHKFISEWLTDSV